MSAQTKLENAWSDIFPTRNRNAGGPMWFHHIYNHAESIEEFDAMSKLYCGVSGSVVRPQSTPDRVRMKRIDGSTVCADYYRCCWPCSCDIQKYALVETMNVLGRHEMSLPFQIPVKMKAACHTRSMHFSARTEERQRDCCTHSKPYCDGCCFQRRAPRVDGKSVPNVTIACRKQNVNCLPRWYGRHIRIGRMHWFSQCRSLQVLTLWTANIQARPVHESTENKSHYEGERRG